MFNSILSRREGVVYTRLGIGKGNGICIECEDKIQTMYFMHVRNVEQYGRKWKERTQLMIYLEKKARDKGAYFSFFHLFFILFNIRRAVLHLYSWWRYTKKSCNLPRNKKRRNSLQDSVHLCISTQFINEEVSQYCYVSWRFLGNTRPSRPTSAAASTTGISNKSAKC